jgi:uncharacterized protein (TIGR00304 family)
VFRPHHALLAPAIFYQESPELPDGFSVKSLYRVSRLLGTVFDVILVGILLIIAGFAIVAFSVLSASGKTKGEVRGAGVVMIGPIPIVFGSDAKWVGIVIGLVIILMILSLSMSKV